MASVFDVAMYILDKKGPMSTWKLQKLCYYAQAWHYTWTERPLFSSKIEAWVNGPVCKELYNSHRGKFSISKDMLPCGDENLLTADEKESIDIVLKDYGDLEPYKLREQTHAENPWKFAREGVPDGAPCDKEITLDSMGNYYGSL